MKKLISLASLFFFLLLGAGCQNQGRNTSLPPAVNEPQTQIVSESEKQDTGDTTKVDITLYKGLWFDIEYPQNFSAKPTIKTDEAYFLSPDGTVEFFVYSPLWAGNPENYLTIAPTEELVDEKIEETKEAEQPGQYGDKITRFVTVKAKDGSYYRSFVSIKEQINTGSEIHHVFGIKYQDNTAYEKYRDSYITFKESLNQYSD
ncbi:MAG: hypothetical protein COY69_01025 [Candidatus Magasanikbacteria bacterium CG_4_10_14_0_8_um_filter_32_14]|uniref:Lipoprotein n=1 Tax=Candidatus Magasanikbacteria bacterium CG_4_10_14_0_8_um_filter_32_14 TaxID=1974640 RepID=A0A2M7R9Y0_9BACT|nr:MAG: hypothetical protein COY69_01025 [Candidatus Magasanikbacteria bacterium CG_4_10_14_0_8_um_filter_32_14]